MIHITTIGINVIGVAPNPGTDYRLINTGELGRPGDDYFDPKSGQWLPDQSGDYETPFEADIHLPARRPHGPSYAPYDMESIPLPLVVRQKKGNERRVILTALPGGLRLQSCNLDYDHLLEHYIQDDGTPCGVPVSE